MQDNNSIYVTPKYVDNLDECSFYHTMNIPGYGLVEGDWDLRGDEERYLGKEHFNGKRVLEIGPANGCLSFYMEKQGAEVVAFDLSEEFSWDIVPFAGYDCLGKIEERKEGIRKINNGFWLCHRIFKSKVKVVYGTVYNIPGEEIGMVDITTFCSTLLHMQNPFIALRNALSLTKEKVIITEIVWNRHMPYYLMSLLTRPQMLFVPQYKKYKFYDVWWFLSPALIKEFIGVLGFRKTEVKYFFQKFEGRPRLAFNVIGTRTAK